MRLTNKNSLGSYFTNIRPIDSGLEKDLTIYGEVPIKLGQLEDIEERHNIESFDDLDNRLKVSEIIKEKIHFMVYKAYFDNKWHYFLKINNAILPEIEITETEYNELTNAGLLKEELK